MGLGSRDGRLVRSLPPIAPNKGLAQDLRPATCVLSLISVRLVGRNPKGQMPMRPS